jgi:hypothetical protein
VTRTVGLAALVEKHRGGIVAPACSSSGFLRAVCDLKTALRLNHFNRTALRELAVEYGMKQPALGFRRGMELCGVSWAE